MAYARTSNEWALKIGSRVVNVRGLGTTRALQESGVRKSDADQLARRGPKPNPLKKKRRAKAPPIAPIRDTQAAIVIAAARAPVEHGFAALKNWRILPRLRLNPARATTLLRTLLVLTNLGTSR